MSFMLQNSDTTVMSTNVIESALNGDYSASADYVATQSVYLNNRVWECMTANGPATAVVTPGSDINYWIDKGPAPYSPTVDYLVGDEVVNNHRVWTANSANGPTTTVIEPIAGIIEWTDNGATNAYKLFDEKITTQTVNSDLIEYKINSEYFDTVMLLGFEAESFEIEIRDQIDESLIDTIVIAYDDIIEPATDYDDWFFGNTIPKIDYLINTGTYYGAIIVIKIHNLGSFAKCGSLIIGRKDVLGNTQYGVSIGQTDYSKVTTDDNGDLYVKEGRVSIRNNYSVLVDTPIIDVVNKKIRARRGKLTVIVGNQNFESMIIYGIIKHFDLVVPNPKKSEMNLEIEGEAR